MRLLSGGLSVAALMLAGTAAACGTVRAGPAAGTASTAPRQASTASTAPASTAQTGTAQTAQRGADASPAGGAAGKDGDALSGISCAGGSCVAVGHDLAGGVSDTLVESLPGAGKAWQVRSSPGSGSEDQLSAVSCANGPASAEDRCLAVGQPVLAGNGGTWRVAGTEPAMSAVSCAAAASCMLAGSTSAVPVFATWNGTAFRNGAMRAPAHAAQSVAVAGVSCPAAGDCVAVGDYTYGVGARPGPTARDKVLAEAWNGHGWQLMPTVNVGTWNRLTAVSCVSAADCTAVGVNAGQYPFAEHWDGTAWRVETVPTVSTVGYLTLSSVSCPSRGFCVAVGAYQGLPVAETLSGGTWRVTPLPRPPGDHHSAQLTSVSCASAVSCAAVGTSGDFRGYAEVYAGGTWRLSAVGGRLPPDGPAARGHAARSPASAGYFHCLPAGDCAATWAQARQVPG